MYHRGGEKVAIRFSRNAKIENIIKQLPGARWSQTYKSWYLPLEKELCKLLYSKIHAHATLDYSALKTYLQQRNVVVEAEQTVLKPVRNATAKMMMEHPLSKANLKALYEYKKLLVLKNYSKNTCRVYLNEFHLLLRKLGNTPIDQLKRSQIERYLLHLAANKHSEAQIHSAINAIKFYFEKVLGNEKEMYELPRPKKPKLLPDVLAVEEVMGIIINIENIKHRAIIMVGYSAGLRASEIVNLQLIDIDSKRMMIHIRRGKGDKDRFVPLSIILLDTLRAYFRIYHPKLYLFVGEGGGAYSVRSAQEIIKMAKYKAGVKKNGSLHMLRHSYATHLLETGTDISIIQKLLGHSDIKTTLRYTHIACKTISKVESPLDKLSNLRFLNR